MGQAKQRGTFEERKAQAIGRNAAVLEHIVRPSKSESPVRRYYNRHGLQRLSVALICAGIIGRPSASEVVLKAIQQNP